MPIQITNSEPSNTQFKQGFISSELKLIFEKYANQPLLLEKLLLQKNANSFITLKHSTNDQSINNLSAKSTNTHQGLIVELPQKLPNSTLSLIKHLANAPELINKVTVSLNQSQEVILKINLLKNTAITNTAKQQLEGDTLQLIYKNVKLNSTGELALSGLKSANNQIINPPTSELLASQTKPVQLVDINQHLGKIAANLIKPTTNDSLKTTQLFTQISNQLNQLNNQLKVLLQDSRAVDSLFSYAKQTEINLSVPNNIRALKSSAQLAFNELNKLIIQNEKTYSLTDIASGNSHVDIKNLVTKLINSGNLFENALKQRSVKNDSQPSSFSSKVPSDNKLILSQISHQLNKLLTEISHYLEKPATLAQIESVSKQIFSQSKELTPLEKHQLETQSRKAILKINNQQELVQTLTQSIKSLQLSIGNNLLHIEQNQLHSLKSEQFNLQQFLVDLPIKQNGLINTFEMRFESQGKNTSSVKNKYWKVVVRFDLEPLGPMFAEIQFENQKLSTHIFAEKIETANLLNEYLPTLKKSLFSAGVDVNKVSGSQGNIPENLRSDDKRKVDTHV